jgi:hypothetical protein
MKKIPIEYSQSAELVFLLSEAIADMDIHYIRANGDLFSNLLLDKAIDLEARLDKLNARIKYAQNPQNAATFFKISKADELCLGRMLVNCEITRNLQRLMNDLELPERKLMMNLTFKMLLE